MTARRQKATRLLVALSLFGLAGTNTSPAAPAKLSSAYVSLKEADCTVVKAPGADDDYQDWSVSRCGKPVGGWSVYVEYGDAREDIVLRYKGTDTSLRLWEIHTSFSSVGPTLEFRLRNGVPFAAVVRHIHHNPEDSNIKYSALTVSRLRPKPCVVADFPAGPNQSALARAAADKAETLRCLLR